MLRQVKTGGGGTHTNGISPFVDLSYHSHQLANLVRSHASGDFCIVGPSGCGKSTIVKKFAEILNYEIEPVILYQV